MRTLLTAFAFIALTSIGFGDERIQGSWKAVGLVDQGLTVAPENIRDELAKYAQLDVEGNKIKFISPATNELRVLTFSLDSAAEPKAITLVNEQDQIVKGIYRIKGDQLEVCLAAPDAKDRPLRFESTDSNKTMFVTLRSLNTEPTEISPIPDTAVQPVTKTTVQTVTKTVVAPTSPAPAQTTPARKLQVEMLDDAQLAKRVTGSWKYLDRDSDVLVTLNGDGTFSLIREFNSIARAIFAPEARSSGTWSVEDGRIVVKVTAAWGPDKRRKINQVASYRVNTISSRDLVMISVTGELIRAVRVG